MNKIIFFLFLGAWMTTYAQEIDRDILSLKINKADAENMEKLKAFIWKKASVVIVNGDEKLNTLSEFKFDENGELQMQNIDAQTTVRQKRGIRGRMQQNQAEENIDYVEEALKLMIAYTYMSKGQLLDFLGKAELSEADGILTAKANDVYIKGDMLTVKVDKATNLFIHKHFSSSMGEDLLSGEINYAKFDNGISHVTDHTLNLPAKNAVIKSENKDYSQRIQ